MKKLFGRLLSIFMCTATESLYLVCAYRHQRGLVPSFASLHECMLWCMRCLCGCNKPVTVITTSPSQHEWRCRSLVGVGSVQLIKTDRKSERWLLGVTKWRTEEWKLAERLNCLSCGLVCCEGGRWWMINGGVFCSSASHPGAPLGAGLGGDLLQKRPSRGKWRTL